MKKDPVKELIEKSGHDLSFQVKDVLEANGWRVKVSPYYTDIATGKPREIDVVAERTWEVSDDFFRKTTAKLTIRLFIECKHLKETVIFWLDEKRMRAAIDLAKDNVLLRGKEDHYLQDTSTVPRKIHHYVENQEAAKTWSKSGNNDAIYDGVNGSIHSLLFFEEHEGGGPYTIDYPIILVEPEPQADLLVKNGSGPEYTAASDDLQLEIDYAVRNTKGVSEKRYFLVDVVRLDALNAFLKKIEGNDAAILRRILAWELRSQEAAYGDDQDNDSVSFF